MLGINDLEYGTDELGVGLRKSKSKRSKKIEAQLEKSINNKRLKRPSVNQS